MRSRLATATASILLALAPLCLGQDVTDADFVAAASLPPAPDSRVLDQGRIFTDEEEIALGSEIKAFAEKNDIDLYVAGYSFLLGETIDDRITRLVNAWDKDEGRETVVLLYTRANESLAVAGSPSISQRLSTMEFSECINAGTIAAKKIGDAPDGSGPDHAGRIRAATTALTGAIDYKLARQTFIDRLHRRGFLLWGAVVIGAICIGSGLWLLILKHFENRRREEKQFYYFPTLPVGERLGAPFGGGNAYVLDSKAADATAEKKPASKAAASMARAAL